LTEQQQVTTGLSLKLQICRLFSSKRLLNDGQISCVLFQYPVSAAPSLQPYLT
jgi:hypothetical protein